MNSIHLAELSLGQALAHLRYEKVFGKDSSQSLTKEDADYLSQLRAQTKQLQQTRNFRDLLFIAHDVLDIKIINQKEHLNFFLNLFLIDTPDKDCYNLAIELNNHFDWHEGFSQVLNDFFLQYNDLVSQSVKRVK